MGGRLHLHRTAEGWLYVAAVIDLFSRRVVGWSMSDTMTAQLVTDALVMAIWRRGKPDALLHHSDQGSQYTSEQFQRLIADNGVICSMSRSGNVWDNAPMESFFSSLKTERIARKTYRTRNQARADVFDYIERFYNPTRRHSTLGYLSPVDFEKQAIVAQLGVRRTGCSSIRRVCPSDFVVARRDEQIRASRLHRHRSDKKNISHRAKMNPSTNGHNGSVLTRRLPLALHFGCAMKLTWRFPLSSIVCGFPSSARRCSSSRAPNWSSLSARRGSSVRSRR